MAVIDLDKLAELDELRRVDDLLRGRQRRVDFSAVSGGDRHDDDPSGSRGRWCRRSVRFFLEKTNPHVSVTRDGVGAGSFQSLMDGIRRRVHSLGVSEGVEGGDDQADEQGDHAHDDEEFD